MTLKLQQEQEMLEKMKLKHEQEMKDPKLKKKLTLLYFCGSLFYIYKMFQQYIKI